MKKIILMGAVGCGKTTLCQALYEQQLNYQKTQAVAYYPEVIDTPGEFILHRQYYSALTVSAADAEVIGLVQSISEQEQIFSPGFALMFPKPVIGIVTKTDLMKSPQQLETIKRQLTAAGAKQIFELSSYEQKGLTELKEYLNQG